MKLVHSSTTPADNQSARPTGFGGGETASWRGDLITVITVRGEIDAHEVGSVTSFAIRSALISNALLLDLREVSFFAVKGISLLFTIDRACRGLEVPWILMASSAVARSLRVAGQADDLPVANSKSAAMQYFAYLSYVKAHPPQDDGLMP